RLRAQVAGGLRGRDGEHAVLDGVVGRRVRVAFAVDGFPARQRVGAAEEVAPVVVLALRVAGRDLGRREHAVRGPQAAEDGQLAHFDVAEADLVARAPAGG